jgi:hypothetical protein
VHLSGTPMGLALDPDLYILPSKGHSRFVPVGGRPDGVPCHGAK